ncbi:NUP133 [Auxenochlorella protothecoides x Auxenochlorella symbiontica]
MGDAMPYPALFARQLAPGAGVGFSAGWCWILARTHVSLWNPRDSSSVLTRRLPIQVDPRHSHVKVVPLPTGLCLLLVTGNGEALLYESLSNDQDPYCSQLEGRVTAAAASRTAAGGVIAAIGTDEGQVHLLRSFPGLAPVWSPLCQARDPSPGPGTASPSMLQRLSALVTPGRARGQSPVGQSPSGVSDTPEDLEEDGAVVSLHMETAGDRILLLLAQDSALQGWLLDPSTGSDRLWRIAFLEVLPSAGKFVDLATDPGTGQDGLLELFVLSSTGSLSVLRAPSKRGTLSATPVVTLSVPANSVPVAGRRGPSCKLLAALGLWAPQQGALTLVGMESESSSPAVNHWPQRVLAVSSDPLGGWLVAGEAGLHHIPPDWRSTTDGRPGTPGAVLRTPAVDTSRDGQGNLLVNSEQAVLALVDMMQAACQGHMSTVELASRARHMGSVQALGRAATTCSDHIADALPRIFQGLADSGGQALESKLASHGVFLQILVESGLLEAIPLAASREVLEDGQRIAALLALYDALSEIQQLREEGREPARALEQAVEKAGSACLAARSTLAVVVDDREPRTLFFACPSLSSSAFLDTVVEMVADAPSSLGGLELLDWAGQLSHAVQASLERASQYASQQSVLVGPIAVAAVSAGEEPAWTAGPKALAALLSLTRCLQQLLPALASSGPALTRCLELQLGTGEAALNAAAAAVSAAETPASRQSRAEQYAASRDEVLDPPLLALTELWRKGVPESQALLARMEAVAEAHNGYSQLFAISEIIQDRQRLYDFMDRLQDSITGESMAEFAFQKFLDLDRPAELLDLPGAFDERLAAWLSLAGAPDAAKRLQLQWLHHVHTRSYPQAAESAGALAAAEKHTASDMLHLLAIRRLANLAGTPSWPISAGADTEEVFADTDRKAALVHKWMRCGLEDTPLSLNGRDILTTLLAKGGVEACSAGVEAFSLLNPAEQEENRPLALEAWKQIALSSDWESLARDCSTAQGTSQHREALASQPLCAVADAAFSSATAGVDRSQVEEALQQAAADLSDPARACMLYAFSMAAQG